MKSLKTFKISSSTTNVKWRDFNLADNNSIDWEKAVNIFKDRFESRFFKPIDALLNDPRDGTEFYSGFSVLAIDCLLIETFNQFYHGINSSGDKFKSNLDTFKDFFSRSKYFKDDFDSIDKIKAFYDHIRCGLLHQAETKGYTTLNKKRDKLVELIENDGIRSIKLNRIEFHKRVVSYFNDYLEILNDKSQIDIRKNFKNKMDLITRTDA
jgi:hypothetical protein